MCDFKGKIDAYIGYVCEKYIENVQKSMFAIGQFGQLLQKGF